VFSALLAEATQASTEQSAPTEGSTTVGEKVLPTNIQGLYKTKTYGQTLDRFSEIKKALDEAGIPRDKFSAWLKKSYGKDVETVSVLKTDKEKILKTIKENPTEIMV
jgi:hypothetical protein